MANVIDFGKSPPTVEDTISEPFSELSFVLGPILVAKDLQGDFILWNVQKAQKIATIGANTYYLSSESCSFIQAHEQIICR